MLALLSLPAGLSAQEHATDATAEAPSRSSSFKHAINMCPGGLFFGILAVNYNYLFSPHHSIVIRGDYESIPDTYTEANIDSKGWAAILNYRYHFSGELKSVYLGAYGRYRRYSGNGTLNGRSFDFARPDISLGANVGYRWVGDCGFNVNVTFGYGVSFKSVTTEPSGADIDAVMDKYEEEYDFMGPFLGEISIGYAF